MNTLRGEAFRGKSQLDGNGLAEQLVDNPGQMERYDRAKWNLLGDASRERRFEGHHPWLKKTDSYGAERTMSIPVFSGYSPEAETVMLVRKDPWTHQNDPDSWLVGEQNLVTGEFAVPRVLSANVDRANRLWLQLAPTNFGNWPPGLHPALFARPYDQIRITGPMDKDYHLETAEYRDGRKGRALQYEDIEALESMIIAVQQQRWAAVVEARRQATLEDVEPRTLIELGSLAIAS